MKGNYKEITPALDSYKYGSVVQGISTEEYINLLNRSKDLDDLLESIKREYFLIGYDEYNESHFYCNDKHYISEKSLQLKNREIEKLNEDIQKMSERKNNLYQLEKCIKEYEIKINKQQKISYILGGCLIALGFITIFTL